MKAKLIALVLIVLGIIAIIVPVSAGNAVVGISKGQTFDYSYQLIWSSTDPTAITPNNLIQLNNTQTIQLSITDVSGTKISIEKTNILEDGTQNKMAGYVDINTGTIEITFGSLIVSANLNVGDLLYPSGGHATINDASFRSYSAGQREINRVIYQTDEQDYTEKVEIYFDKLTGVAVSYSYDSSTTSNGYTATTQETLICTNIDTWIVAPIPNYTASATSVPTSYPANSESSSSTLVQTPNQTSALIPILVIVLIAVILAAVAIIVLSKRRKKKSNVDQEFAKYAKPQDS
jgi:hypothetical protein